MSPLLILNYHRITRPGDAVEPRYLDFTLPREELIRQLECLQQLKVPVVDLARPAAATEGRLAVALTFDDGHQSDLTVAADLLESFAFPATFFPVTANIGTPGCLGWAELRQLQARGFGIGSHGHTHRNLRLLSAAELPGEVVAPKQQLEQALGTPVDLFSIPYGRYSGAVSRALYAAGYRHALSTEFGLSDIASAPFILRRWNIRKSLTHAHFEAILQQIPAVWLRYRAQAVLMKRIRQLQGLFGG